jgi:hypothetical protein
MAAKDDPTITPDLRLRAAIGLAAYQHPNAAPLRVETFVGPIDYTAPTTPEEARAALRALGERFARRESQLVEDQAQLSAVRERLA